MNAKIILNDSLSIRLCERVILELISILYLYFCYVEFTQKTTQLLSFHSFC